jgi:hypothetical protein
MTQNKSVQLFARIGALSFLAVAAAAPAVEFEVQPLSPPPGTSTSEAEGLNDKGQIVGIAKSASSPTSLPCWWDGAASGTLPYFSGQDNHRATTINNSGQIIGYSTMTVSGGNAFRGMLWTLGSLTAVPIGTFTGVPTEDTLATGINDSSVVVGFGSGALVGGTPGTGSQGFKWTPGSGNPIPIGLLVNTTFASSVLTGVNAPGTACGSATDLFGNERVIRYGSAISNTGVPAGYTSAEASGINSTSDMCGWTKAGTGARRGFVWTALGGFTILPMLAGSTMLDHVPADINDRGEVVGNTKLIGAVTPLLWRNGFVYDLSTLLINVDGWSVLRVNDINERSEMVGYGNNPRTGLRTAVVIRPVQTLNVQLGLWDWSAPAAGVTCDLVFTDAATSKVLDERSVTLAGGTAVGTASVKTTAQGNVKVRLKASHWLSRTVGVTLATYGSATANAVATNGDVDGDNEVSILDYLELSAAYDTSAGDAAFNTMADLDGDNLVSILDYLILSATFEKVGN